MILMHEDKMIAGLVPEEGGGGGHVIQDASGTAVAQQPNMQFTDAAVSNDGTNSRTKVSVMQDPMTKSAFEQASDLPDGIYPLTTPEEAVMSADMVGYESGTVKDALDEMIKVIDIPYSDFTWNSGTKAFVSGNAYPPPNGYITLGFLAYFTNGDAIASARYNSSSHNVRVLGWIPTGSEPVDSTYKFVCKILFKKS